MKYLIRFEDPASDGCAAWLESRLLDEWTPFTGTTDRNAALNYTLEEAARQQDILWQRGCRAFIELL